MSVQLGIDYGTSNTVAVLRWPNGKVRPLLFDGFPLLPSAVFANPDGSVIGGRDAVRSASLAPASYEPHVKRRIDDLDVLLGDRVFPVVDLVAATLRRVAAEAVQAAGTHPAAVCLTYPVAWGPARRSALLEAARIAGLPQPVLVPEPVAAASYLAATGGGMRGGDCMVVYDLGAGTFDVSVVSHTPAGFETLASRGLDDFGGLDLDAQIVAAVGRALAGRAPEAWQRLSRPANPSDLRHFRTLWNDAREVKEALTRQSSAGLYVTLAESDVLVTREEYERAALPLLARTVEVAERCIREARIPRERISSLFLVGGGSRTPMAATLLHRALGLAPVITEQPETVVAEGALTLVAPVRDPLLVPVPSGAPVGVPVTPVRGGVDASWPAPPVPLPVAPEPAPPTRPQPPTPPPVAEFARKRGQITLSGGLVTLVGALMAAYGLAACASANLSPTDVMVAFYVLLVPAGAVFTIGTMLLGRAVGRHRLRIDPDGIVVTTTHPGPGDRLRMGGPLGYGLLMVAAGLLLTEKTYTPYGSTAYGGTSYLGDAVLFILLGVVWLVVGIVVARKTAVRLRRWNGERRFPWRSVDVVSVRRVGWRRASTVLVGARSDSDLYVTPATADRFRRDLRAFAVCDLSASVMPVNEVTVALRRFGGDRWRDSR